jgi:hypothetical protein
MSFLYDGLCNQARGLISWPFIYFVSGLQKKTKVHSSDILINLKEYNITSEILAPFFANSTEGGDLLPWAQLDLNAIIPNGNFTSQEDRFMNVTLRSHKRQAGLERFMSNYTQGQ